MHRHFLTCNMNVSSSSLTRPLMTLMMSISASFSLSCSYVSVWAEKGSAPRRHFFVVNCNDRLKVTLCKTCFMCFTLQTVNIGVGESCLRLSFMFTTVVHFCVKLLPERLTRVRRVCCFICCGYVWFSRWDKKIRGREKEMCTLQAKVVVISS
jgi:hypothetical protein